MDLKDYPTIRISRDGKKEQKYFLLQQVKGGYPDLFYAVKDNGERPRKVFLVNLKEKVN